MAADALLWLATAAAGATTVLAEVLATSAAAGTPAATLLAFLSDCDALEGDAGFETTTAVDSPDGVVAAGADAWEWVLDDAE